VWEQVADGELASDVRIVEPEVGEVVDHSIVPAQLSLVCQHGERSDGHRFGGGPDREARVLGDGRGLAQLEHTVPPGEDERVVLDDGDGQPRHVPVAYGAGHVSVEGGQVG
jgi:hypothetical protein